MHHAELILLLASGFVAALGLGLITHRLGLSPIVGYLLAGIAIGPHTLGFTADKELAQQLSEIGVVLLMFGVGLQFHFKELLAVRRIAIPGALVQSAVATGMGALVMRGFGWDWTAGVVFGLALSVASTVLLTRVLADHRQLHTPIGHISVGWLVMEDLLTIFVLVLMPAVLNSGSGTELAQLGLMAAKTAAKIAGLIAFTFLVGGWGIPKLLGFIAGTGSRELFTLGVLAITLGIAVGSAALFGVSMALGAFLAGMVVARSEFSSRAATDALPMRDAFAVLFFVSVGMLFDFHVLRDSPGQIAATLAVILIGKPLAAVALVVALRHPFRVAVAVALALAQIGEFSFILAALGRQLGVLPTGATDILIAAAVISIIVNPVLYRTVAPIERWVSRRRWLWRWLNVHDRVDPAVIDPPETRNHRAVVVGFGPVGQTVARLLRENGFDPVIVELELEHVQRLRSEGHVAVYGDATKRDTLLQAGIEQADILIVSTSSIESGPEVIRLARTMRPGIIIVARTAYLREAGPLRKAGAGSVFTGEGEVALAMTEFILERFRATREQIDHERRRIRDELFDRDAIGAASRPPWRSDDFKSAD